MHISSYMYLDLYHSYLLNETKISIFLVFFEINKSMHEATGECKPTIRDWKTLVGPTLYMYCISRFLRVLRSDYKLNERRRVDIVFCRLVLDP